MKITYDQRKAIDAVKPLDIDEHKYDGCSVWLGAIPTYSLRDAGQNVVTIAMGAGAGFEATRKLTLDDVHAIHEWAGEILAAAEQVAQALEAAAMQGGE